MMARKIWLLAMVVGSVSMLVWVTNDSKPPIALLNAAIKSYRRNETEVANKRYLTLIDYTKPIFVKRLWVVELATRRTVLNSHVSHAWKSGLIFPEEFSNAKGSEKSCLGSFITQTTYRGRFGYSLRVKGIDAENSNTLNRSIVFHPSLLPFYSQGCWMTTSPTNLKLINLIKDNSFLYVAN